VLLTDGDAENAELRRQLFEEVSTNALFLRLVADDATEDAAAAHADAKGKGKSEAECDAAARDARARATEKLITVTENTAVEDFAYLVTREPNDNDCQWRRPAVDEIIRALVAKPDGIKPKAIEIPNFSVQLLMASLDKIRQDISLTVIMFNLESELLTFVSPAHRIAAAKWVKENPVPA